MSDFRFGPVVRDENTATIEVGIPADLDFLEGHFPGDPIVPGVAQIVTLAEGQARRCWGDLPFASEIKRVKFMSALRVGDVLVVALTRSGSDVRFEITRGDDVCSKGTLRFAVDG